MLKLFLERSKELSITELPVMMILNGLHSGKHDYLFTSTSEISYTITGLWIDKKKMTEDYIMVSRMPYLHLQKEKLLKY